MSNLIKKNIISELKYVYSENDTLIIIFKNNLNIMTFVPNFTSETNTSRKKIPQNIPLNNAINNMSRVALLIDSISSGDYTFLNDATQDYIHQNIRLESFPKIKYFFSSLLISNSNFSDNALTTDTPTPCNPPDTLYES